ncbi:MAG: hypothetical protein M1820_003998 [Bogoriella megaspora]|nr:MAG: hypothetical protein M1820_003998 [Bogoriella megaspora]
MPDNHCTTCGNLRYSPSFEWNGTEDAQKRGTFAIAPTVVELQHSALQSCGTCDLLVRSIALYQDVSNLATVSQYGSPCRISARSKHGKALCISWAKEGTTGTVSEIELSLNGGGEEIPQDFAIGTVRSIKYSLGCDEVANFVQRSLDACTTKHNDCARKSTGFVPKRLLHVGHNQVTGFSNPYLVEDLNYEVPYVALSYCWGKKDFRRMTKHTLEQDKRGINISILPQTFYDTIFLLRTLGISYVWIDALCIIQSDRKDWEIEGAKMDKVYTHALFVISVTFGDDVYSGFLSHAPALTVSPSSAVQARERMRASQTEHFLFHTLEGRKRSILVREKLQHEAIVSQLLTIMNFDPKMPVFSRAWCLQERLLAARTVHFTPNEMMWECSGATWCECEGSELDTFSQEFQYTGSSSANSNTPLSAYKAVFRGQIMDEWYLANLWQHTVSAYSWRDLTYQSDRLPALSGLAALFQSAKMGIYLAGLWRDNLEYYLHWRSARCDRYVKRTSQPSWSWASTDGPILWEDDCNYLTSRTTILNADIEPKGSIGQTTSGTIILSGQVIKAKVMLEWFDGLRPDESFAALCLEGKEIPFILDVAQFPPNNTERQKPGIIESQLSAGENVTCLRILTRRPQDFPYTLVLRPSPVVPDAYERVGLCDSNILTKFFHTATEETLKLV